jgi:putative transposase
MGRRNTHTRPAMDEPLAIVWSRPLPAGAQPSTVMVRRDPTGRYERLDPGLARDGGASEEGQADRHRSGILDHGGDRLPARTLRTPGMLHAMRSSWPVHNGGSPANSKAPANREKQRRRVAKIHARRAARRKHSQHQLSTKLGRSNQTIVVESLAVKHMMQHPTLARAIADVGWGELVRQLEYKAAWYGQTVVKIDRFYP